MLDFFRGRHSWGKLEVLLERLPWDSQYKLAIDADEELAEAVLDAADGADQAAPATGRPALQQWSHMAELRASLLDGLMVIARTIVMVHTPRGKHIPPMRLQPRPETGLERARRRRQDAVMSELEAKLAGLNARWGPTDEGA